jgi:hypothetical protein
MPYVTGKQKWTDDIGLPSLEAEFNSSGWIIPMKERHLLDCKCDWCTWMNDMRYYPQVGEADTVMACWFAREGIRLYMGGNVKESIEIPKKADEFQDVFKILNIDPKDYDFL